MSSDEASEAHAANENPPEEMPVDETPNSEMVSNAEAPEAHADVK